MSLTVRHMRFGWWLMLVSAALGLALEAMNGFKLSWYLSVANETRRLLLTLAHAHGVLLGLVNVVFAVSVRSIGAEEAPWARRASPCLILAGVLLPSGFALGSVVLYGADPGLGIALVPVGAVLLLAGLFLTARGVTR